MRQAMEGSFLDVLASYTTYKAYWRLLTKVKDDPATTNGRAGPSKSFVELHPHAIGEKVKVCVEHFATKVQGEIGGKAKAMIVTRCAAARGALQAGGGPPPHDAAIPEAAGGLRGHCRTAVLTESRHEQASRGADGGEPSSAPSTAS